MDNLRRFILVFVAAIFLTLSTSGFILAEKYKDSYETINKNVDVDATIYDPNTMDMALFEPFNDNILIFVGDKSNADTELIIVANVNSEKSTLSFMYIPEDFKYETYSRAGELLKDIGPAEAADSLASFFNTTIDYYIHISSENFVKIINALDFDGTGVKYNVPCDLNYKSGSYDINLKKGIQQLKGEQALQLIQFYRTRNNIYTPEMVEYYDGTKTKRIEASQEFLSQLIRQKLIKPEDKDFSNKFSGALSVFLEECDTNLELIHLKKLGLILSSIDVNKINYFMLEGDNTLIGSGSLVYNSKVRNLITDDMRDGAAVWETMFSTN